MSRDGSVTWDTPWLPLARMTWHVLLCDIGIDAPSGQNPGWVVLSDHTAFASAPAAAPSNPRKKIK